MTQSALFPSTVFFNLLTKIDFVDYRKHLNDGRYNIWGEKSHCLKCSLTILGVI